MTTTRYTDPDSQGHYNRFGPNTPEVGAPLTTEDAAELDGWLVFRAAQWAEAWRPGLTVEDAHTIEARIIRAWFGTEMEIAK